MPLFPGRNSAAGERQGQDDGQTQQGRGGRDLQAEPKCLKLDVAHGVGVGPPLSAHQRSPKGRSSTLKDQAERSWWATR